MAFDNDIIDFVNGQDPWKPFTDDQPSTRVYRDGKAVYTSDLSAEQTGRKTLIFEIAKEVGMDKSMDAWEAFMQGH